MDAQIHSARVLSLLKILKPYAKLSQSPDQFTYREMNNLPKYVVDTFNIGPGRKIFTYINHFINSKKRTYQINSA